MYRQTHRLVGVRRHRAFEALFAAERGQRLDEVRIVLDDQQAARAIGDSAAQARFRPGWSWRSQLRGCDLARPFACIGQRALQRVVLGENEREDAALSGRARELDVAAEQARQIARDGKTQARAAVTSVRARIDLLERLENELLLFACDADAGVFDREAYP